MQKAIFSKVDLSTIDNQIAKEYLHCVQDILSNERIQELKLCAHHYMTTRFQHSLNVSYYSFLAAKKLHLDAYSIARAGLLHDLYFYDWRNKEEPQNNGRHCSNHPKVALSNAKEFCEVNAIMEDAIVHHMWPMTLSMPRTKEGWLLQAIDKYCATSEVLLESTLKVRYAKSTVAFLALIPFINIK